MDILKIYDASGANLLYTFGRSDNVVKYGQRKYGTFKYGQKTNDGAVQSIEAYAETDSVGTELPAGTMSASVKSHQKLNIPQKAKVKLFDYSGVLVGSYELERAERVAARAYNLTCYDYLGVAENTACQGFYIASQPLYKVAEAVTKMGIPMRVSDAIRDDIIDGESLPSAHTMREFIQLLVLAYGYIVTTLGVDGILLRSESERSSFVYFPENLKENPTLEEQINEVDKVEISKTTLDSDSIVEQSRVFMGYVRLTSGSTTTVRLAPYGENPANLEFPKVYYEKSPTYYEEDNAVNNFPKIAKSNTITSVDLSQRVLWSLNFGHRYVADYVTAEITPNNEVLFSIDNQAYRNIIELAKEEGEDYEVESLEKISENGDLNALLIVGFSYATETTSEVVEEINVTDGGESVTTFDTPFVLSGMGERIAGRFQKNQIATFACIYRGEKPRDEIRLPQIYDETASTAIVESVTIVFGGHQMWADIKARIYNIEE